MYTWIKNRNIEKKKKASVDYSDTPEYRRHPSLELKLSIIHRRFEKGEDIKSVSKETGYTRTSIYLWKRKYIIDDTAELVSEKKHLPRGKIDTDTSEHNPNQNDLVSKIKELEMEMICGKKKECENCPIKQKGVSIYPVYYTNKPYDATEFAKTIMAEEIANVFKIPLEKIMINGFKSPIWEVEKNSLIKKECHKYDQEWRMIANCPITPPVMVEWIPDSVILGLRTSAVDAKLIISMAKQAGIKNVYKSYIDNSNRLNAFKISEEYICKIIGTEVK